MKRMELTILSPNKFIEEITFNHEAIKTEIDLRLKKYEGITYDEKEVNVAKSARATLTKFKTAVDDKRKEIRKQCLSPYDKFNVQVQEILTLIEKPILAIDKQVKTFEEHYKQDKRQALEDFFEETVGDLKGLVKFELVWNEKWLNKTFKLTVASSEIESGIAKVVTDFKIIEEFKSEFETEMKSKYLTPQLFRDGVSMAEAMAVKCRLDKEKVQMLELKQKQAAQKLAGDELKEKQKVLRKEQASKVAETVKAVTKQSVPVVEPTPSTPIVEPTPVVEEIELEEIRFSLMVTPEQKAFLRNYILNNKIPFGKV